MVISYPHPPTETDPQWTAVIARDAKANGRFVYGVKTTRIFCLPSCPSRHANRNNVVFFSTKDEAVNAGFRPCLRCKPDQWHTHTKQQDMIESLCRFIESAEQEPSLAELSERAGLSTYHLQRLFKRITGVTPKNYARINRMKRLQTSLMQDQSVTQAAFDSGYNSNSRFYAEADQLLGMKPKQFKAGGMDAEIFFAVGECSLGSVLVAQSKLGVCAITLGDDPEILLQELQRQFPSANLLGGDHDFETTVAQIIGFIEQPQQIFHFPLDIRGTLFQQRVWQALQTIKPGETLSYSQLAERIGAPKAARAVARACATNVIAVAIPCHRIVRHNGDLSGYRWGVERKRKLLDVERLPRE